MEMRRHFTRGHSCIYLCTGEEQHQEPNAETDHPECSTPPGVSTLGSTNLLKYPYIPLLSWHALLHQANQIGVSSSSNGGLQIMLPGFHSPLFHFKVGTPLASKNFRSTFLSLVWWSNVATIQPNTIHSHWCSQQAFSLTPLHALIVSNSNSRRGQIFNAHYIFALTKHCAEIGVWGPFGPAASKHWHNFFFFLGGGGGIDNLMQRLWPSDRLCYRVQRYT